MINDKSYIHIGGWMLNELHLKGSELIIYATIFSFTNGTDDHCFHGSSEYLGERAGVSRRQTTNSLRNLEKKGLIFRREKKVNGVKFVDYYTNFPGGEKTSQDPGGNFPSYNSTYNSNISISNDIDNISSPQEEKFEIRLSEDTVAGLTKSPAELSPVLLSFIKDSFQKFKGIEYQWKKQGEKFFWNMVDDYNYLCKEYGEDLVQIVLQFVKQDDFRSKQIQSIGKLRKKNKDGVPYIVVMLEKIQNYKPKVIDLDNMQ